MNKRERLAATLVGEAADRPPVALWRRFPGDDQRAADHARSMIEFQRTYDWDMVIVAPASHAFTIDYGLQDEWRGSEDGTRAVIRTPITRSLDWTTLRPLDPARGALGRQIETLTLVAAALSGDVPVLPLLASPLTQVASLSGDWLAQARTQPDRLHSALNTLTENTLRMLEAVRRLPLDGCLYSAGSASYGVLSEEEYRQFGMPYDTKIIEALPTRWWLNIICFPEPMPMLRPFLGLNIPCFGWRDRDAEPDLAQGRLVINRAIYGGLSAQEHLVRGTPIAVQDWVRDALTKMNGRRLIVGAGGGVPITAPLSNLRAVRTAVERA